MDHHEHLQILSKKRAVEVDLPFFLARGYIRSDLVSSGLPESFYEPLAECPSMPNMPKGFSYLLEGQDESDKMGSLLKPYLDRVRNTTYYQYLLVALRDLYGFEGEEFGDDWKTLSEKIRAKSRENPEWSLKLLEKMGVYRAVLDVAGTGLPSAELVEDERIVQVVRMDWSIVGDMKVARSFREGDAVRSLDDYLETLDEAFERSVKAGAVGIKSGLAYQRTLEYREVPRHKAEKILAMGLENSSSEGGRVFQDFMMHEVCKRCAVYDLPFQIHTGIQAGNYNTIGNADPTHLTNILRMYPDVKFDIFHGGYPYCREAGILAKYFPNAYVDGCWLTHISPSAYKEALNEWLEVVPATKIFAWGGDHLFVEYSYASLKMAKEIIAEVLASKVANGSFSLKTALWVAQRILGENATEVYGFERK